MAKLKIKDLPKDLKVSEDQMKRIKGGFVLRSTISSIGAPRLAASGGRLIASGGRLFGSGSKILGDIGGVLSR